MVDPFQLISSGSLLIVAEEERAVEIIDSLSRNSVQASIIGEVKEPSSGRKLVSKSGEKIELVRPVNDHLWKALEKSAKTCSE